MENPPIRPPEPEDVPGEPAEQEQLPLAAQFSDQATHEPRQIRVRDEWPESMPPTYPFFERRHNDRRRSDKSVDDERRHPEVGDRRRLPLMRPLPGFHIDGEIQSDAQVTIVMGSIPSIRDRIFVEQAHQPGEADEDVDEDPGTADDMDTTDDILELPEDTIITIRKEPAPVASESRSSKKRRRKKNKRKDNNE